MIGQVGFGCVLTSAILLVLKPNLMFLYYYVPADCIGHGTVYFYDIRADKYLELFCGAPVLLEAGPGWLCHDDTYHDFFIGHEYPNAIYTHCYDPAGTRLFTAGI